MSSKWATSNHVYNSDHKSHNFTYGSRLSMLRGHENETQRSMTCQSFQYEYEFNIEIATMVIN